MKNNYKKLNRIFRFTKMRPEMFLSITVSEYTISFLTKYDAKLTLLLKSYFKNQTIDANGFLVFTRGNFSVTLY